MGLRVAGVADARVFLAQALHRAADLVLVTAALRLDGVGQNRLRELDGCDAVSHLLVGENVAGMRVLELGHGAKVTGLQLWHMGLRLPLKREQVPEALGAVAGDIAYGRVRLERAVDDTQHRDAASKRIRDRL